MAQHESKVTQNHDEIRRWVEERGGKPASVNNTGDTDDPGILRIDFPGHGRDEDLEHVSWDVFFAKFDENNLAFLYQETTEEGDASRFNKFIRGDSNEAQSHSAQSQKGREGRGAESAPARKSDRARGDKRR